MLLLLRTPLMTHPEDTYKDTTLTKWPLVTQNRHMTMTVNYRTTLIPPHHEYLMPRQVQRKDANGRTQGTHYEKKKPLGD